MKFKNKQPRNYNKKKLSKCPLHPFKSKLEKNIYKIIKKHFSENEIMINKRGLVNSNKKFELDLYFPEYKIGIEIQGPTHTQNENNILKDYKKKMAFFRERNIKIIYIYTNSNRNKSYSLKKCIDILKNERDKQK